ncbi:hypothetical protein Salat_1408400 [Sesamum alatum]|uniref:Uncharacterized protein n=1 Tax=Sesamum alatum TaxID=300844 RepID=A0AAE1Y9Z0_9LAMI|nr:hypothetical protein Salat_1408400 [Sesamum alatum]
MVGNGASLLCSGICKVVPMVFQNHNFTIPFYLIPIQGVDAVLGVKWLQSLGSFISNYSISSMQFHHHGSIITLIGDTSSLSPTTFYQFCRLLSIDSIVSTLSLCSKLTRLFRTPPSIRLLFPQWTRSILMPFQSIWPEFTSSIPLFSPSHTLYSSIVLTTIISTYYLIPLLSTFVLIVISTA